MSIEIVIGKEDGSDKQIAQLSTANGLKSLAEWATATDPKANGNLHHLFNFGWVGGLDDLADQLRQALADRPPPPKVRSTATHLLSLLDGRGPDDLAAIIGD